MHKTEQAEKLNKPLIYLGTKILVLKLVIMGFNQANIAYAIINCSKVLINVKSHMQ